MVELQWLKKNWVWNTEVNPFMAKQPILRIRDYFGEKTAIYFAWLEFYSR